MWEREWWRLYKTITNGKLHIRGNFPYRRSLTEHQLLEGINNENLFGYVLCDIEAPQKFRANIANLPPLFKNTLVSKNDISDLMKTYAEDGGIVSTSENDDIKPHITKWNSDYSSAVVFFNRRFLLQKHIALLSTAQGSVSRGLYRQQCTQEDKTTRIPIQVSLRRQ